MWLFFGYLPIAYRTCLSVCAVFLVTIFSVARCSPKVIRIGAIFHDGNVENEIAFRFAVARFNQFQMSKYILQANVRRAPDGDSFKTGEMVCDMVKTGISAIFGPDSPKTNGIVQSIAENLEIPQFQTFWNPKLTYGPSNTDRTIFNLHPESKLYSKALATLLREMRWKSYAVIYESDEGLVRLQEVLKSYATDDVPMLVKKLTPGNDHRSVLKEVKDSGEQRIILDCEVDHILDILQQAQEVNLVDEYHSYILTSLDAHTLDFKGIRESRANISILRIIDTTSSDIRHVVQDWNSDLIGVTFLPEDVRTSTALLYDALNFFVTTYKELDLTENMEATPLNCDEPATSKNGIRLSSFLKLRPLYNGSLPGPLTGPIFVNAVGVRTNFNLEVLELTTEGVRKTGTWNSNRPNVINFTFTQQERQLEIVQQLSQKVFRVTSRLGAPYLMLKEAKLGEHLTGNKRFEGYSVDLIGGIANILNFTFKFDVVPDNNYGSYNPETKQWDGLIQQLLDRKADLAICDLTITYERRQVVDFTMPFMTLGISILFSKAVKEPPELFSFMHPLSLDIWLYMATAYLAISIVIYIVARFAPGDWENPHPCNQNPDELENIWDIKNCLWLTLGSLMTQGCDILPKGISTRLTTSVWWFFILIMAASYTANLAAFLTMERMGPTIESAEDLTKQSNIKYGCVTGGATASFFRNSNFSTYHKMWTQMQATEPSVFEKSNKEGVKRVKTSKRLYAFLMESSSIEYEMERDCDLRQVGGLLDTKGYGIAMPVNSPYRTAISGAVLKMQEDGKLLKLKEKWWKKMHGGGKCSASKQSGEETAAELSIDHVGGVFVVLCCGILLAFVIALAEFVWNARKISVKERIPLCDVLREEMKFTMNFRNRNKFVRNSEIENGQKSSSCSTRM